MSTAILFLAEGFEEIEALTPVDYLRRAGVNLTTAAITDERVVTGSHGIPVIADALFSDLERAGRLEGEQWDAALIPGGMPGSANLAAHSGLGAFLKNRVRERRVVAAICAAPALVLAPLGLLEGRRFTCYPGMEEKVSARGARFEQAPVVLDLPFITSRGAGTAAAWSCAIIAALQGSAAAERLAASVLLDLPGQGASRIHDGSSQ